MPIRRAAFSGNLCLRNCFASNRRTQMSGARISRCTSAKALTATNSGDTESTFLKYWPEKRERAQSIRQSQRIDTGATGSIDQKERLAHHPPRGREAVHRQVRALHLTEAQHLAKEAPL